jgi:hypothetical protein
VQRALHLVGVAAAAGGQQQPPVPVEAGDRRAGLAVRTIRRQLERIPEGLVAMARPVRAGYVGLLRDGALPQPLHRLQQRRVAGLEVDVGHAGRQVELAHGVPDRLCGLPHGQVVLQVARPEAARPQQTVSTPLDHARREREVAVIAGMPVQLDERRLDLGMPVEPRLTPVGAEALDHQIGKPAGHVEEVVAAHPARDGDGALDQVTEAVELMALHEIQPPALGLHALDPGVQVAVGVLDVTEQRHGLIDERAPPGFAGAPGLPADRLEHLVDVGVGEPVALERLGRRLAQAPEVREIARRLELADRVADRRRAVERRGAVLQRPHLHPRVARRRDRSRGPHALPGRGHGALAVDRACVHRVLSSVANLLGFSEIGKAFPAP